MFCKIKKAHIAKYHTVFTLIQIYISDRPVTPYVTSNNNLPDRFDVKYWHCNLMNVERPQSLTRLMKTRESTSPLCTCILMLIPPLPRLPAFDDSGRGRLHSAVPLPVATHLPAHRLCTAASPPGGSCAVHDGHPPQRRSSAILPPPSSRGKGLNEDPLCKCDAKKDEKGCNWSVLSAVCWSPLCCMRDSFAPLPPACQTGAIQSPPFTSPILRPRSLHAAWISRWMRFEVALPQKGGSWKTAPGERRGGGWKPKCRACQIQNNGSQWIINEN